MRVRRLHTWKGAMPFVIVAVLLASFPIRGGAFLFEKSDDGLWKNIAPLENIHMPHIDSKTCIRVV